VNIAVPLRVRFGTHLAVFLAAFGTVYWFDSVHRNEPFEYGRLITLALSFAFVATFGGSTEPRLLGRDSCCLAFPCNVPFVIPIALENTFVADRYITRDHPSCRNQRNSDLRIVRVWVGHDAGRISLH
jgi:hypothetical protein